MSWTGSITVVVNNQTGGAVSNLSVTHMWKQSQDTLPGQPISLANNASAQFTANTGSGGSDTWSVTFNDASGNCWYRNGKQCNIESGDIGAGQINFNLQPGSQGFSIELPESSSCNDNYYNSCNADAKTDEDFKQT